MLWALALASVSVSMMASMTELVLVNCLVNWRLSGYKVVGMVWNRIRCVVNASSTHPKNMQKKLLATPSTD